MATSLVVLALVLIGREKQGLLVTVGLVAMVGNLCRDKPIFWKLSLAFFGLLSVAWSFRVFGGLEPHSRGVFGEEGLLMMDVLLLVLFACSTLIAFFAGLVVNAESVGE